MLKVECPGELPEPLQGHLERRHANHDRWNSLRGSNADREIKQILLDAFYGKCGYCEKIEADTVDHFWPKDQWPEKCWAWDNYVLACDQCQRSFKRDSPPVDENGYQMVNPRFDDPVHFLYFDFETGAVAAVRDSEEHLQRGQLTINRLGLEKRGDLQEQQRVKFWGILDDILTLVEHQGDAERAWRSLSDSLQPRSPYLGMIRQLLLVDNPNDPQHKYRRLVEAVREVRPDFDDLIDTWCLRLE